MFLSYIITNLRNNIRHVQKTEVLLLLQSSTLLQCFTYWLCTRYLKCFFLRLRFARMSFWGCFVWFIRVVFVIWVVSSSTKIRINQFSVHYTRSSSLTEYCNTEPSLSLYHGTGSWNNLPYVVHHSSSPATFKHIFSNSGSIIFASDTWWPKK